MRFIIPFIVIAIGIFSLTWYLNYDYNLFEYRLVEAIATYIYNDYSNNNRNLVIDEKFIGPEITQLTCVSWESLEVLVNDTTKKLDSFESLTKIDESLMNCLKMDLYFVNTTISDFQTRVQQAADTMPVQLELVKSVFLTTHANLNKMNDELIGTSQTLLRIIDKEQISTTVKAISEIKKTIARLLSAIPNLEYMQLECSCSAAIRLNELSNEIKSTSSLCVFETEVVFRSTYNTTTTYLNEMLDEISDIVTMSREKPISFIDDLFYIPVQVCIIFFVVAHSMKFFLSNFQITIFFLFCLTVDKYKSIFRSFMS